MPSIPHEELRNHVDEILRRAEAGERFTITSSGRPVAELGPAGRRQWVSTRTLEDLFPPAPASGLAEDLAAFEAQLRDPWS